MKTIVEWHPYPEEKPRHNAMYMCTVAPPSLSGKKLVEIVHFSDKSFEFVGWDRSIIAWAEIPEPYKGKLTEK